MKLLKYLFLGMILSAALLAAPQQKAPAKSAPATAEKRPAPGPLIDINSASETELKQLAGIGDAYAAKIVQNRPYRAKNQLVQKKIIPAATYDKIKDQIIAKQGTAVQKK